MIFRSRVNISYECPASENQLFRSCKNVLFDQNIFLPRPPAHPLIKKVFCNGNRVQPLSRRVVPEPRPYWVQVSTALSCWYINPMQSTLGHCQHTMLLTPVMPPAGGEIILIKSCLYMMNLNCCYSRNFLLLIPHFEIGS